MLKYPTPAPPPSPLPRRRRRAGLNLATPLVAAFEQISIAKLEMAGSTSSSAPSGGKGPLPSLYVYML